MDRTLIDAEPAVLTFDSAKFAFKDGITVTIQDSVQPTPADIVENAGDTWDDCILKITGTPSGENESLTKLFPYTAFRRGQNIFGADKALTIHTTSGRLLTIGSAAVTKSPSIHCGPAKTLWGSMEYTGVRKNGIGWGTAASLWTEAASAFTDWTFFDGAGHVKMEYAAAWGVLAAPWNGISTMEGWDLEPTLNLKWIQESAIGTVQATFVGEQMVAKCRPLNVVMGDILAAHPVQGGTARRGARIATASNLVLTPAAAGAPTITLTAAQLRTPGFRFGNDEVRIGEIGFEAQRTYTLGQPQPLYTIV